MPSIIIHFLMNHDKVKIEISDEECDIIKQSASKINMITSETDYCLMLRDNLLDAFNDFATNGPGTDKNFNRLNRYIMNWLNSFYAWIGFHERHYKDLFSVLKTKYYDTYFEYRFAYAMRKFTTHQALCVRRTTFDALKETTRFEIPINDILKYSKEMKKSFIVELISLKDTCEFIDLEQFTRGFFTMFELFQSELWEAIIPQTDIECEKLCSYAMPYMDKPITRYYLIDNNGDETNMNTVINHYFKKKKTISLSEEMKKFLLSPDSS